MKRSPVGFNRHGSALMVVALFLPVLLGFVALAVDVGHLYRQKARFQTIADFAVLTALGNVDWSYRNHQLEQVDITETIRRVAETNGLPRNFFGTPTFVITENNVTRVTITTNTVVDTFFCRSLGRGWQQVNITITSAAEVEYDNTRTIPMPPIGVYGSEYVNVNGAELYTYRSSDPDLAPASTIPPDWTPDDPGFPADIAHDWGIGCNKELHFNGTNECHVHFFAYEKITASGLQEIDGNLLSPSIEVPPISVAAGFELLQEQAPYISMPMPTAPASTSLDHPSSVQVTADGLPPLGFASPIPASEKGRMFVSSASLYNSGTKDLSLKNNDVVTFLAGGVYVFNDFDFKNGSELRCENDIYVPGAAAGDPVKIYLWGDLNFAGQFTQGSNQMKIYGLSTATGPHRQLIDIGGNSSGYIDVYAPEAEVDITGGGTNGAMFGRVFAHTVTLQSRFFFDVDLGGLSQPASNIPEVIVSAHLVQ